MTPLWGTKTPSALVGDKSGGDRRAARSLPPCALWLGMGRLWRGMGGGRPPHRQHGPVGFSRITNHESRDTAFTLFFPRFPTISHDFPAFPGPPHPPSADQVSTRRPPFLVSRPGLPPPPRRCFPARRGAAWGGYGAASAAWGAPSRYLRTIRTGNRAFRVFTKHEDTNHGFFLTCCGRRVVRNAG